MSDPRDELLDRIQEALHEVRFYTDAAHERYAKNLAGARAEEQWAYAAGQCRAIAELVLREIEQHKRARSKTGSG